MARPYIIWIDRDERIQTMTDSINECCELLEQARHMLREGTSQGRNLTALRISAVLKRVEINMLRPARGEAP